MSTAEPLISVIICSYNGAGTLDDTLSALVTQSLPRSDYEVIVVDDGSSDDTKTLAEGYQVRVLVNKENLGLAASRNVGLSSARAPLVAFTDDDCRPSSGWLEAVLTGFRDPWVMAVGGPVVPAQQQGVVLGYTAARNPLAPLELQLGVSTNRLFRLALYLRGLWATQHDDRSERDVYSVVGANMAFRRSALERLGGFHPLFRFGGDEEELCKRLRESEPYGRFLFVPEAEMLHSYVPAILDTLRRARAYGKGKARARALDAEVSFVLYPWPILQMIALAWALRRPHSIKRGAVLVLPLLLYPGWPLRAARRREVRALAYPYLQLAEESASMYGQAVGRVEFADLRKRAGPATR